MTNFLIRVVIDPRRAVAGAAVVRKQLLGVSAAARRANFELLRAFSIFAGISIVTRAVRTLADFSQAISTVEAVSSSTSTELAALEERAKQLGATTRFTATQVAEGMVFLARTGLAANEVLDSIAPALFLAQSGNIELARAADITTSVLKAFRLEVGEVGRVVDVLALTTTSAKTDVNQLGQAMKFVAPISAGLGISLEETSAALGVLSDNGLQASLAGTGLRRVLSELESPTGRAVKILRALGLTAEEIQVSQVGLITALTRLKEAGITTGEALDFFGKRGGPAFEILSNSIPDVVNLTEELLNAAGSAERIAIIMDDNLNGALLKVKSAYEALILALGVEPAAQAFFESLATAVRFLAANLDTAGVAALSLILALTGGPILGVLGRITGITVATFTLSGALGIATIAAKLLGRALLIGFVIEGIILVMDAFNDLNEIVTMIGITWPQVALFAIEGFANAVIGGLLALERIIRTIILSIGNSMIAGFAETGAIIGELISDPARFFRGGFGAEVGVRLGREMSEAFVVTTAEGFAAAEALLSRRFLNFVNDDAFVGPAARLGLTVPLQDKPVRPGATTPIQPTGPERVVDRAAVAIDDFNRGLQQQIELSRLDTKERTARNAVIQLTNTLTQKGITIGKERIELLFQGALAAQEEVEANERLVAIVRELEQPLKDYNLRLATLESLLGNSAVNQLLLNKAIRETRIAILDLDVTNAFAGLESGLLTIQEQFTDVASLAKNTVVDAFRSAEDALVRFVTTGKLSFASLIDNILVDITRLAIRQSITGPLASLLGSATSGGGFFGSLFSGIGSLFSGGTGVPGGVPGGGAGVPGLDNGGQFEVAGIGGVDQNLLSINGRPTARVSRGETVQVIPRGGGANQNQRPIQINFNISTPDADSFQRNQGQILSRAQTALSRANMRNS